MKPEIIQAAALIAGMSLLPLLIGWTCGRLAERSRIVRFLWWCDTSPEIINEVAKGGHRSRSRG